MSKIAAIITRHWKSLVGFNLLVLVATIATVAFSPRVWTATTQFIMPDTTSHLDASLGTLGSLRNGDTSFSSTQVNPLKVQASILTSYALLKRVWARDPERNQFSTLRSYGKLFKVTPQDQSTIISLDVNGSSPELARQRAIALTQAYQQHLNELRSADSAAQEQFSQKPIARAQKTLTQAQMALAQFKESTGLIDSAEQTKAIISTINSLGAAKAQALAQAKSSADRLRTLSNRLGMTPAAAIASLSLGENQDYQFVRRKLVEVEADLVEAQSTYTDLAPKVQSLLSQRNELQRQLQRYIATATANTGDSTVSSDTEGRAELIRQLILAESDASAQQQQAQQLQSQIDTNVAALSTLPRYQARLLELQRQYDIAEGVYKGLIAQVKKVSIDSFNSYPNVQVLTPPAVDLKPSSPKLSLAAINAILASVFGSIALALLLEGRNPLLSPKDLEGIEFQIVVSIHRLRNAGVGLDLDTETETEVDFQRLASAVSLQDLKNRRLLIASAIMGEGKTTVTLNLARALADLGFRVLVVDGDFRRAQLSQLLGYTSEEISQSQPVRIQPSIDLLPTLPQQSKILDLVRARFEKRLAAVQSANEYDYVLVDSAPVSLTSETALMAAFIPSVLFVVRPGVSKSRSVKDSLAQLTQHNARILGLVVNEVETKSRLGEYRFNTNLATSKS